MKTKDYQYIIVNDKDEVVEIILNRPDIRNAINNEMLEEISQIIAEINSSHRHFVVTISGKGAAFCAGADLKWLEKIANDGKNEALASSLQLARTLFDIKTCRKPTIAIINGDSFGGGNGIIGACDFAIAMENARFSFPEVKLGLIPATIGPYIIEKIGSNKARRLMLTGRIFDAYEALNSGLISHIATTETLNSQTNALINTLLEGTEEALAHCKQLINHISSHNIEPQNFRQTASLLTQMLSFPETIRRIGEIIKSKKVKKEKAFNS